MSENYRDILSELALYGLNAWNSEKKKEWELVLIAMEVDYYWEKGRLLVPTSQMSRAVEEVRQYEEEEKTLESHTPSAEAEQKNALSSLFILSLLLLFFTVVYEGLGHQDLQYLPWFQEGSANAAKIIQDGEWWRTVTSLTLHGDPAHVLGNVIIGAPFMIAVCSRLGLGLGWLTVILAGALGNYINSWIMSPAHDSIGFSTAVFAAVGIMSIHTVKDSRLSLGNAFVLGLALLAMLGVGGENTDVGAHLFGLASGFGLGLLTLRAVELRESLQRIDFLFGATAALLVVESWLMALWGESLLDVLGIV